MLIDAKLLSEEALRGIAEHYVISQLSETEESPQFDIWVEKTLEAIARGELVVEYSEVNDSVYLKRRDELPR
ncbi:MAG: YheU family protein [Gammaproteobacteria bacterium]|nr:MAG: YheU family protein [Gammaproteobacteria bacterium]